jgi:hypothetical protein
VLLRPRPCFSVIYEPAVNVGAHIE